MVALMFSWPLDEAVKAKVMSAMTLVMYLMPWLPVLPLYGALSKMARVVALVAYSKGYPSCCGQDRSRVGGKLSDIGRQIAGKQSVVLSGEDGG